MTPRLILIAVIVTLAACTKVDSTRSDSRPEGSVAGLWILTVESPMGRDEMETRFEQTGERLSGFMKNSGADVPLQGAVTGEAIRFDMNLPVRGQSLKLEYSGIVQGDEMSGTVQFGPMGTGKFSGVKRVDP